VETFITSKLQKTIENVLLKAIIYYSLHCFEEETITFSRQLNVKGEIKNGQSRETCSIGYTKYKKNKR